MNFWLAVHSSFEKAFSALEQTKKFFYFLCPNLGPSNVIYYREKGEVVVTN